METATLLEIAFSAISNSGDGEIGASSSSAKPQFMRLCVEFSQSEQREVSLSTLTKELLLA
jgi:hypothetical protein